MYCFPETVADYDEGVVGQEMWPQMYYHRPQSCRRTSVIGAVTCTEGRSRNKVKKKWPLTGVKATIVNRAH